jgi:hypothetical protein
MRKIHQFMRLVIGLEGEGFLTAELATILDSCGKVNSENIPQSFDVE